MEQHHEVKQFGKLDRDPKAIFLKNVRLLPFSNLYRPGKDLSGNDVWSASFIVSEEQYKFLVGVMKESAKEAWKDQFDEKWMKIGPKNFGARPAEDKFLGKYLAVRASTRCVSKKGSPNKPPKLYQKLYKNQPQKPCVEGEDGSIYEGCYVDTILTACPYTEGSIGVKFLLKAVAFNHDGSRLGAGYQVADEDLNDLAEEGDEPDFEAAQESNNDQGW